MFVKFHKAFVVVLSDLLESNADADSLAHPMQSSMKEYNAGNALKKMTQQLSALESSRSGF